MKVSANAKSFKVLVAVAFAASATILPISGGFAAGETLGARCTTEGVMTGTKSTSLMCAKGSNGKLTWQRVKLASGNGRPVANLTPPAGSIEFWHYRPEDVKLFTQIIDAFQAKYPQTKIVQVFKTTTDYNATARAQILGNPKAALFATSRGSIFNDFVTADSHWIFPTRDS